MRPTAGLVSRGGVYAGWPSINGSLGPMARTVTDLARLLDCMVGYDPEDPITSRGVGHVPDSYAEMLDETSLKGARIGVLREPIGYFSDPNSDDFNKVTEVFDRAVSDLKSAGAEIFDPIVIPDLSTLLNKRASNFEDEEQSFSNYVAGSANAPFASRGEAMSSPLFAEVLQGARRRWESENPPEAHYEYLKAREILMTRLLGVMAEHKLDAIVHKAVEHQPTLIRDGVNPPFVDQKGAPSINTFLVYVPSVVVPAGFTRDGLPAGITFLGRPYDDANMIRLAHAYERATQHRRQPENTP